MTTALTGLIKTGGSHGVQGGIVDQDRRDENLEVAGHTPCKGHEGVQEELKQQRTLDDQMQEAVEKQVELQ